MTASTDLNPCSRPVRASLAALCWALLFTSFGSSVAHADDSPEALTVSTTQAADESDASSTAQDLFEAGKAAMARGNYDVACEKFTESNQREEAVGTLLNLAHCEERRGRLVIALRTYVRALARLEGDDPRRSFARKQAGALTLRVPKLTVALSEQAPRHIRVTCNGERLTEEELGRSLRFDPGRVVVVAEARGYHPRVYQVDLRAGDDERLDVNVGARIAPTDRVIVRERPGVRRDDEGSTWGYVFLTMGLASTAAATTFGVLTYSEYRTVREHCDIDRNVCFDAAGQRAAESGANYETLAYVAGGVGLVSLSLGSILVLSDGEPDSEGRLSVSLVAKGTGALGLGFDGTF